MVIGEALFHSSHCPHILLIVQHILLHQHQIYRALYPHLYPLPPLCTYATLVLKVCVTHTLR